jgi:putative addiction module killer protein
LPYSNVFVTIDYGRCRRPFGPGYRVYFGKDGDTVIILLGGSVKKDQADAIVRAKSAWVAYKASKRLLRK